VAAGLIAIVAGFAAQAIRRRVLSVETAPAGATRRAHRLAE
jgi:hypothetical protein